jgi:hypothetical protein
MHGMLAIVLKTKGAVGLFRVLHLAYASLNRALRINVANTSGISDFHLNGFEIRASYRNGAIYL